MPRASRKCHYMALLGRMYTQLATTMDEPEMLCKAVQLMAEALDAHVITINMLNRKAGVLFLAASICRSQENPEIGDTLEVGVGIVGAAAKLKKSVVVANTARHRGYIPKYPSTRSELACPILHGEELLGVLNLESAQERAFKPTDVNAIELIASALASVIQNARTYHRVQELNRTKDALLLRLSHDYQTIFENAMQGMSRSTADGQFILVNPAFARILGYSSPEEMLQLRFHDLIEPKRYEQLLKLLETKGAIFDEELQARRQNGQMVDLRVNLRASRDQSGKIVYYDAAIEDISEDKRLQRELQRRERMATMGELAAAIAHEIRNPLAAVINSAEELQARVDFSGTNRRLLEIILEEAERLERVVRDFLIFARPAQPRFSTVNINQLIERTLQLVMQRGHTRELMHNGLTLEKSLKPDLPSIQADPDQLVQVLLNILINAVQGTKGVGKILISSSLESLLEPVWLSSPHVVIEVSDTGSGIKPKDMERIFEPFFTTKPSGTGLGLPIAKQIIETHSGTLSVKSVEGTGTRVRIVLPVSQPAA